MRMISLPGIGGSDERHWQSHWEADSRHMHRFTPSSWDAPDFDDWSCALDRAASGERVVLVAHSLSCHLAVRWAQANTDRVKALFLVAPPDPVGEIFPAEASSFATGWQVSVEVPSVIVASTDDPYCAWHRSECLADEWGTTLIPVGPKGHLNSDSGLGAWPEGRNLLASFLAGVGSG